MNANAASSTTPQCWWSRAAARTRCFPHWVTLSYDDPHAQPEPDAERDAALFVLDVISEELGLIGARIADLAKAEHGSPCGVIHLADKIRQERDAENDPFGDTSPTANG